MKKMFVHNGEGFEGTFDRDSIKALLDGFCKQEGLYRIYEYSNEKHDGVFYTCYVDFESICVWKFDNTVPTKTDGSPNRVEEWKFTTLKETVAFLNGVIAEWQANKSTQPV